MNKSKIKLYSKTRKVLYAFTGNSLTKYSGLNILAKYLNRQGIVKNIGQLFPTEWFNSTKFGINQVLLTIILAAFSGVNRLNRISNFTNDALVRVLLKLDTCINEHKLSETLKNLGQSGARKLQSFLLGKNSTWLCQSGLESITLDADSTVSMVYGNQEGAEKGFNSKKKGAKSYHPLLVFVSEIKLLYHSWFRCGSSYTSNGIVDFLKEVEASLPANVKKVFFRADSGFFSGSLFDFLERLGWDYLVKVKLKNLKTLMEAQSWEKSENKKGSWTCEFDYKASGWSKARRFKAIRSIKRFVEKQYLGKTIYLPEYEYACYVSSYDMGAEDLHGLYTQRSTSETWIEQVKSQLLAGRTLTDDFWANDILWQLNVFAYNISVTMRGKHKRFARQEHRTFREWFVELPGHVIDRGRHFEVKMYEHYWYKDDWLEMAEVINAA